MYFKLESEKSTPEQSGVLEINPIISFLALALERKWGTS
jgi:hypothetical protein